MSYQKRVAISLQGHPQCAACVYLTCDPDPRCIENGCKGYELPTSQEDCHGFEALISDSREGAGE